MGSTGRAVAVPEDTHLWAIVYSGLLQGFWFGASWVLCTHHVSLGISLVMLMRAVLVVGSKVGLLDLWHTCVGMSRSWEAA